MTMSEQELRAAPESEYMSANQLAFFSFLIKTQLAEAEARHRQNVLDNTEHEHEADPIDRASQEEVHQAALLARGRDVKLIKQLQDALARIKRENYGYCEDTGEPIGLGRLLAQPAARLSVEAQHRRELLGRQYQLAA